MGISSQPSVVTMPPGETRFIRVLDFLIHKFSRVGADVWLQRMEDGKVHWDDKTPVAVDAEYAPYQRIFYYREVSDEPVVPFTEDILFQNRDILVACKPHFLQVTPTGSAVDECLLNRLRRRTGIADLAPVHRIDRETAGIVLFSLNPETRSLYHQLFVHGDIQKTYQAVARVPKSLSIQERQWLVANRMIQAEPWFRMKVVAGEINARSDIRLLEVKGNKGVFELRPLSGKTHQLRVHMSELGFPLMNDRYYPELQPKSPDNYDKPLQLLAKSLEFDDPVSGQLRRFESGRTLQEWWQVIVSQNKSSAERII